MSGRSYRNVYRVDAATGKRDLIVKKTVGTVSISPNGRYVLYSQNGQWWSYDATTAKRADLTGKTRANFTDVEDDHLARLVGG